MLHLTGNTGHPLSQSSVVKSTRPLTPNKGDYVVPANQTFSVCLFLIYSLSCKSVLPSAPFFRSPKENCPLHEMLKYVW